MESNDVLDKLPRHLLNLVIDQPYNQYTPQDHAVWRYVMRQNVRYLPGVAHHSYIDGLKRTGISIDRIPEMYGMNRILKEIGWAAVAVDGFIPPAAFMEFQAYNVLVIAADIRPVDQVLYTPAPDIIHEAAGHAPIIADEEYSAYLRDFGKAGSRAFSSVYDNGLYEAIRHLSILKADPYTSREAIEEAEASLDALAVLQTIPSEMALLRNLHWWTVEYGLIGTPENPKIYGAGLLSSIGESHNCLKPHVKKLPYSLDAKNFSFDITRQQPQLFVTPDFKHLNTVLNEYINTMAVRRGGLQALQKALQSESVCTAVYSSGLQVSGKLASVLADGNEPVYIGFEGPSMLAYADQLLDGHGVDYHKDGFGSPVGSLKGISGNPELMSEGELSSQGIEMGKQLELEFNSGVKVSGYLTRITGKDGKTLIFTFSNCSVTYHDRELFNPEWGTYDMAVGSRIISAYAGPADADAFGLQYPAPAEKTHHLKHTDKTSRLHGLYNEVRLMRENGSNALALAGIWHAVKQHYPDDWLLPLEIAEILSEGEDATEILADIMQFFENKVFGSKELKSLVGDGLKLIHVNPQ